MGMWKSNQQLIPWIIFYKIFENSNAKLEKNQNEEHMFGTKELLF